jgi:hypothetical protein
VLYQLSYLGTVYGKKSEALLQDRSRKIKLPGRLIEDFFFPSRHSTTNDVAEANRDPFGYSLRRGDSQKATDVSIA